jgi:hypothetical protein
MSDRELLELAAKAAGYKPHGWNEEINRLLVEDEEGPDLPWNPLRDDGDALRLAVKLKLLVGVHLDESWAQSYGTPEGKWLTCKEPHGDSPDAATRRAIVRAAVALAAQAAKEPR